MCKHWTAWFSAGSSNSLRRADERTATTLDKTISSGALLPLRAQIDHCSCRPTVLDCGSVAGRRDSTRRMQLRRLLLDHLDVVWSGDAQSVATPQDASLVTHAAKARGACITLIRATNLFGTHRAATQQWRAGTLFLMAYQPVTTLPAAWWVCPPTCSKCLLRRR